MSRVNSEFWAYIRGGTAASRRRPRRSGFAPDPELAALAPF